MYGESLWKDFLTKNIHIDDDITGLMRKDFLQTAESKFAILVLQLYSDEQTEHDINSYISGIQAVLAGKKQNTGIYTRVVRTDKEMLSIIISFPDSFLLSNAWKNYHAYLSGYMNLRTRICIPLLI